MLSTKVSVMMKNLTGFIYSQIGKQIYIIMGLTAQIMISVKIYQQLGQSKMNRKAMKWTKLLLKVLIKIYFISEN